MSRDRGEIRIAGVDGCKAGWIVVSQCGGQVDVQLLPAIDALFETSWDVVMLDIPIGLADTGRRACDQEARDKLGPKRSSVFFAPTRPQIAATDYDQVRAQGVSLQSFYLFPKIREVDEAIDPTRQAWLHEAHPELAYHVRAREPLDKKRTPSGRRQRLELLRRLSSPFHFKEFEKKFPRKQVAMDDLLDAAILLEVSRDWLCGRERQAGGIETDSRGLKMEICF